MKTIVTIRRTTSEEDSGHFCSDDRLISQYLFFKDIFGVLKSNLRSIHILQCPADMNYCINLSSTTQFFAIIEEWV